MSGKNAQNQAAKARATEVRQRCLDLRVTGMSFSQIATAVGLSKTAVVKHVHRALDDIVKQTDETAERLRSLEIERLDKLQRAAERVLARNHVFVNAGKVVYDGQTKLEDDGPVLNAVDRLLRIAERRARLMGLDAPKRQEFSGPGGGPIETKTEYDLSRITDPAEALALRDLLAKAKADESPDSRGG
jgi:hypothetical protein